MGWFGGHKIGVALMCADWRLHHPRVDMYKRICRELGVDGLDVNAVPGPDGLLNPEREREWESVVGWIKLLAHAHRAVKIAVVAHQRCAGHPVNDDQHEQDVLETAIQLKARTGFEGPVLALVATYQSDKNWRLKEIGEFESA